jgi:hypothetical protein
MDSVQVGYWIGIFFGAFVAGALCGLLPLILGLRKQRRGLALASWITCVVAGLILGSILAVPVSIIFTIVILCLKKPEDRNTCDRFAEQVAEGDALNQAPEPQALQVVTPPSAPLPPATGAQVSLQSEPLFLYIPVNRLILMSIISFSLYEAYWIYKNWRYVKQRDKRDIRPFWRGWFGIFYCHSLLRRIYEDKEARSFQMPSFSPGGLATGWVLLIIVGYAVSRVPGVVASIISALIPSFLCLVPVQNYVNSVTQRRSPGQRYYGWSSGHIVCLVIGIIVWALVLMTLIAEMGL